MRVVYKLPPTCFSDKMSSAHDSDQEDDNEVTNDDDVRTRTNGYESCSSSSGDEDTEHCPICLLKLKLQPVGRPELCKHLFCLSCITQWSKVRFLKILLISLSLSLSIIS